MPVIDKNFELRSGEVQEIISRPPNWIIRWGITLVFLLIILFLMVARIIKYPDVVNGSLTLITLRSVDRNKENHIAQMIVPISEVSKVKKGQTVLIRLDYYSPQEDVLKGKVAEIKRNTEKGLYRIKVTSVQPLNTNIGNEKVPFDSQMSGSGKILTKNVSLFDRIWNSLRNVFG